MQTFSSKETTNKCIIRRHERSIECPLDAAYLTCAAYTAYLKTQHIQHTMSTYNAAWTAQCSEINQEIIKIYQNTSPTRKPQIGYKSTL